MYLNLLCERDLEKAIKLQRDLEVPMPMDMFSQQEIQDGDLQDADCLQMIIDAGMPEKMKENQKGGKAEKVGGFEVFIPKKRTNRQIRYPKDFDHENPGQPPDPERWLPKWQRSRFKKLAKKKGLYIKGAQGDAAVNTDVSAGYMAKSTTHKEAAQGGNKRKKR